MRIIQAAVAGTLESSDVQVRVAPASKLEIDINSSVKAQYGDVIKAVVDAELKKLEVTSGHIILDDKGALDCTLRARLVSALLRGSDPNEASPTWAVFQENIQENSQENIQASIRSHAQKRSGGV